MARALTSGSNHRWLGSPIVGLAEPFSVAAWIRKSGTPPTGYAVFSADTIGGSSRWQISVNATNVLTALAVNTAATAGTANGSTVSDAVWQHVGAVFRSSSSRTAYTNGVAGSLNTTPITVSGVDALRVGARVSAGVESLFFNGGMAHLVIYQGELPAEGFRRLSRGADPMEIRPKSILRYFPMDDTGRALRDIVNHAILDANGTPVRAPFKRKFSLLPLPAAPVLAAAAAGRAAPLVGDGGLVGTARGLAA